MNSTNPTRKMSKTKEEILIDKVGKLSLSGLKWKSLDDRKERIFEAMESYASQRVAEELPLCRITEVLTENVSLKVALKKLESTNKQLVEVLDRLTKYASEILSYGDSQIARDNLFKATTEAKNILSTLSQPNPKE